MVPNQIANDCQELQCVQGEVKSVAKDQDGPPDDQNECTIDSCQNGQISHMIDTGRRCGPSQNSYCDSLGKCVACLKDADCGSASDWACVDNLCCDVRAGTNCPTYAEPKCGKHEVMCGQNRNKPSQRFVSCSGQCEKNGLCTQDLECLPDPCFEKNCPDGCKSCFKINRCCPLTYTCGESECDPPPEPMPLTPFHR